MKYNLFSDVFGEFGRMSKQAWKIMGLVGLVTAASDVLGWWSGPGLSPIDYLTTVVTVPLRLYAAYHAGILMVSRKTSIVGFLRFVGASFALYSLFLLGILGLFGLLPSPNKTLIVTACLTLLFVGWLAVVFLPAWPIAQALSSGLVSPTRLLRGTKGHRWSLFLIFFVYGSLTKIVPSTMKATNIVEAILYAMGGSVVSVFSFTFFVALSVTAWRYASFNDKELYGDEPRAANVF